MEKEINLSIQCNRKPGLLIRVAMVMERRGYSVDYYGMYETSYGAVMELQVRVDENKKAQIVKQLQKLIDIISVKEVEVLLKKSFRNF